MHLKSNQINNIKSNWKSSEFYVPAEYSHDSNNDSIVIDI